MVTTVKIDDVAKKELVKYASILQATLGRKISFDEAIRSLLGQMRGLDEARRKFDSLYGSLSDEKGIWGGPRTGEERRERPLKRKPTFRNKSKNSSHFRFHKYSLLKSKQWLCSIGIRLEEGFRVPLNVLYIVTPYKSALQ